MATQTLRGGNEIHKKISPTYISSDLHSPEYKTRLTIPWKGVQRNEPRIQGGKMWGENLTNYGGIGKFSFMGKRRVRDLFVARNQKHYSSGLSRYETENQPYMLTAFKYSGCRQNDQVLPPCFKIGLNPKEMYVFDGSPILPYFSHNSKHEVFPRHDPDRKTKDSTAAELSPGSRDALKDYYKHLYEMPFYDMVYPDHMTERSPSAEFTFSPDVATDAQSADQSGNRSHCITVNEAEYSRMIPLLAKLCMLSKATTGAMDVTPLKRLLVSYVDDLSTCFSIAGYEELTKVVKALRMFTNSTSARDMGVNLHEYPLVRMVDILDRKEGTSVEKVLELREVLGVSPQCLCNRNIEPKVHFSNETNFTESQPFSTLHEDIHNRPLCANSEQSTTKPLCTDISSQYIRHVGNCGGEPRPNPEPLHPINNVGSNPRNVHYPPSVNDDLMHSNTSLKANLLNHGNNLTICTSMNSADSLRSHPEIITTPPTDTNTVLNCDHGEKVCDTTTLFYPPTGYHHPLLPLRSHKREQLSGTSPCWPPSSSYTLDLRTMQLKSTGSLPQPEMNRSTNKTSFPPGNKPTCDDGTCPKVGVQQNFPQVEAHMPRVTIPINGAVTPDTPGSINANNSSIFTHNPGLSEYKDYLYSVLPVTFDERDRVMDTLPDYPEYIQPSIHQENKENFAGFDKRGRKTYLPPISLSECLPASGDRIQDRLGLKFKTEAHKRFHALYPDMIPDLRDNFNFRKRHFFRGFHTSVMR